MPKAIKTFLICVLIGLAFGAYLFLAYDHRPARILVSVISTASIGSLMMAVIYNRQLLTAFINYQSLKMAAIIIVLILVALIGSEFTLWIQTFILSDKPYHFLGGGNIYSLNILIVLVSGIPIYVSEEWKGMLNSRIIAQQYRLLQLEQQQTVFELELLRAKINPHFLYNVHNTIAGLISKDPQKAEEMVLLLSKFFRFTLNKSSAGFHLMSDELEIVSTYLQMQQIRFGSRLVYTINAAPDTLNLQIPSFVLQPLVENAVKHGIETKVSAGFIDIQIRQDNSEVVITIADSGPGFSDKPTTGMGLQMVTNKLKLLYADNFKIVFNNTPKKYVELTIPARN